MTSFRERMGLTERPTGLQSDGMSVELRNSLWNVLERDLWWRSSVQYLSHRSFGSRLCEYLWRDYFKAPLDTRPGSGSEFKRSVREYFFRSDWSCIYELLEFILPFIQDTPVIEHVNAVLERERSGFRYVSGKFIPVTNDSEVEAVAQAITTEPFYGAREHLRQAVNHLSNRDTPDFHNSINESILAVEITVQEYTGDSKADLGDALNKLEHSGQLHKALNSIRHAMLKKSDIDVSDAKFFLVACSAFVNYLASKVTKQPCGYIGQ